MAGYIALCVLWFIMIIKFAIPIAKLLSVRNTHTMKVIVYGGLALLGIAYLYRFIHLCVYYSDGSGIHLFDIFYLVLKNVAESIITTLLVALAWGWSVVHLNSSQNYILLGLVSALINIVCLIVSSLAE